MKTIPDQGTTVIPMGAGERAAVVPREAHLEFLGLKRNPFPVSPDAVHFFLPARTDTLLTEILHAIRARKGFLVLTGEVGLGKTTISKRVLNILEEQGIHTALVFNTFLQGGDLLAEINNDFGIPAEAAGPGPQGLLNALYAFLMERYGAGANCAILIDDAQNLTNESLEMLRMVSNLETSAEKLVQILLVGQPELNERLNQESMRQLKSRIVVNAVAMPYSLDDLKSYVHFKLTSAGHSGTLQISEALFRRIHQLTGGNPRRINILLDRCLYGLFAYGTTRLNPRILDEVAQELGMMTPAKTASGVSVRGRWMLGAAALALLLGGGAWVWWQVVGTPLSLPVALPAGSDLVASLEESRKAREQAEMAVADLRREVERLKREDARREAAVVPATASQPTPAPVAQGSPGSPVSVDRGGVPSGTAASTASGLPAPQRVAEAELRQAVDALLAGHSLQDADGGFANALARGTLDEADRWVHAHNGQRLVVLRERYGEHVRNRSVLRLTGPNGDAQNLFIWKPPVNLTVLPTEPHDSVHWLQARLGDIGLYLDALDGMAGPRTQNALAAFQRLAGLDDTGRVDGSTLFLLAEGKLKRGWGVQVVSLNSSEAAREVVVLYQRRGFPAFLQTLIDTQGHAWNVVRVGPYRLRDEARRALDALIPLTTQPSVLVDLLTTQPFVEAPPQSAAPTGRDTPAAAAPAAVDSGDRR
ncbi:MAG: AAA family ATPase [Magnetococcus sp. WYHC-3]